ncbi:MAG: Alpha/beta hydrolase family protein [Betaproteobacteria bacterium ADurb.Bin341]|nr:MAG: Alpha/beta hydrolase family protein [Betaproteobacteria bacterium ADurb.Bin341]
MRSRHIQSPIGVLMVFWLLCFCSIGSHADETTSQGKPLGPGRHALALAVDGLQRTYLVHVPPAYDARTPLPLVIMLHGGGGTARAALWETGWAEKADRAGFLAVFPNAVPRDPSRRSSFAKNPQLWNDGSDRFYPDQSVIDDVRFINALLDDLSARFVVDQRRIFVTGFSNGASMSFLAGARLSHRIAAIAPVAGACWFEPVVLKRPVPMLYITGNADPLNLMEGGVPKLASGASDKVRAKAKPPVRESILKWAKGLGCQTEPGKVSDLNGVRTETYRHCRKGAEVVFVTVDGLGHTWAGGRSLLPESMVGKSSDKINATELIWDFFRNHPDSAENNDPSLEKGG